MCAQLASMNVSEFVVDDNKEPDSPGEEAI